MKNWTLIGPISLGLGVALIGAAAWTAFAPIRADADTESGAMSAMLDTGHEIREDITRAVKPAMVRTQKLAADPGTAAALSRGDRDALTFLANKGVENSTEIDALALFDADGSIVAINNVYADGKPVDPERVAKIMGVDFGRREIIQHCVQNNATSDVLEFQTNCDITPAYFDSSGLSVAYTVPVTDHATGKRLGVVSARMRFERLTDLIKGRPFERSVAKTDHQRGNAAAVQFVTDKGGYFSERINSGTEQPPVPTAELARLINPNSSESHSVVHWRDQLVAIFPLREFTTIGGGGIHVMLVAPQTWVTREVAVAHLAQAGMFGGGGLLCILMAAVVRVAVIDRARRAASDALRDAAESSSRSKSEFLANMSHEIRTPMTAILGYAELLENALAEGEMNAVHAEPVRSIRVNGQHLLTLINDILDLSKIEAGKMTVERSTCSICQIVAEVAAMMRVRSAQKGLGLNVRYVFPVPSTIISDPLRLRQVLINLVGNAVKFTERGVVEVCVRCDGIATGTGMIAVDITDTGIGLTSEQISRLFKPFSQADNATTRRFGGTGLGLALSRRLAQELGGDVTVTSTPGKGSTFSFTLSTGDLTGVHMIEGAEEALVAAPEPVCEAKHAPVVRLTGRILLAEDGPDNQRLISMLLTKAGAEVTIAENGRAAVEAVEAAAALGRPYGLILMDMQMPEMDGYAASARIRALGITTPIVALTAHAMTGDREKCIAAGCSDYASKPIDRRALIAVCGRWIEADASQPRPLAA